MADSWRYVRDCSGQRQHPMHRSFVVLSGHQPQESMNTGINLKYRLVHSLPVSA